MLMTLWLRTLQQSLARKLSDGLSSNRRSRRQVNTVAQTEFLEDRRMLAATYFVTNNNDSGAGSLRQAIFDADNTTPNTPDRIEFNIPSGNPMTIKPLTDFEQIDDEVVIDGYTQLGAAQNSQTVGTNAMLLIELSGDGGGTAVRGLVIRNGQSTVRGLVVNNFSGTGIELLGGRTGNTIEGNFIGTDRAGVVAKPNGVGIAMRERSFGNTIGGSALSDRNLISGNTNTGIEVGSSNNTVRGNLVGTNASGTSSLGTTTTFGIRITSVPASPGVAASLGQENIIGGINPGDGNTIAFNQTGVAVASVVSTVELNKNNQILSNSIFSNGANLGLGIDLLVANIPGVTPNDGADTDSGPNGLQNFPVIASVVANGSSYIATYIVSSIAPNSAYPMRVEFFRADAIGQEGKEFLGAAVYNTPNISSGFTFPPGTVFAPGDRVVATATDGLDPISLVSITGNTSEFSASVAVDCVTIVTTTADSGAGSLREAINCANMHPGLDTISFQIPGSGLHTINVLSPLPTVTDIVIIDGTTQSGFNPLNCVPIIELNGSGAGGAANGLKIVAGNSVVRGLVINRFSLSGIELATIGSNVVAGNYIGTNTSGTVDLGNTMNGIYINNTRQNVIGGLNACDRNVISGNNTNGVWVIGGSATSNRVVGNYIGTTADGLLPLGNTRDGVNFAIGAGANTIGGNTASSRNIISANGDDGVELGTSRNTVQKNYIGTDLNGNKGAAGLGNTAEGVRIKLASNSILNNVISGNRGNGIGIEVTSLAPGNIVRGNFIGTNASGAAIAGLPGNGNGLSGVNIAGSPNNQIGGAGLGAKNVISGNTLHGVQIIGTTARLNSVQGNYIGTDVTGTVDMGNLQDGIRISSAPKNTIGGIFAGAGNLISGNGGNGVGILNAASVNETVKGNTIGTDVSGMFALPNLRGVYILNANQNQVGGTGINDGNLISGNLNEGVYLRGISSFNVFEGNSIGVNMNGGALKNNGNGVRVEGSDNRIGGGLVATVGIFTSPNAPDNAANVIAFNGGAGIYVSGGTRNAIRRNSIFNNFNTGIQLVAGGNTLLAAPLITASASGMTASFTTPGSGRVEFFVADSAGSGEGAVFVIDYQTTGTTGTIAFTGLVPNLSVLVATFTDTFGNTSMFSKPFTVTW